MKRTAFRRVPEVNANVQSPALPPERYGVSVPAGQGWAVAGSLAVIAAWVSLIILTPASPFFGVSEVVSLAAFALCLPMWIRHSKASVKASKERDAKKAEYAKSVLLPYLEQRYGASSIEDADPAQRGRPFTAILSGAPTLVILVESSYRSGLLELAYFDDKLETKDAGGDYVYSGDGHYYFFPFSLDSHASHGDGSVHSSSDGGSHFSDSSSGDGGGDSGGDGGGGDGGGGGD